MMAKIVRSLSLIHVLLGNTLLMHTHKGRRVSINSISFLYSFLYACLIDLRVFVAAVDQTVFVLCYYALISSIL